MATLTKPSQHGLSQREASLDHKTTVVPRSGVTLESVTRGKSSNGGLVGTDENRHKSSSVLHVGPASSVNGKGNTDAKNSDHHHHFLRGVAAGLNPFPAKDFFDPQHTNLQYHGAAVLTNCTDSINGGSEGSSYVPPPLPPVPWEMAEAIKRQEKGAGAVKYWRAKHIQQAGGEHSVHLKSGLGGAGVPNTLLPTLKQFFNHGHGNGNNGLNVGGERGSVREARTGRSKDGLRQRAGEHLLTQSSASLLGGSLGHSSPFTASYKRSVTSMDSLTLPPFSSNQPQPLPHLAHKDQESHTLPDVISLPQPKIRDKTVSLSRTQNESRFQGQGQLRRLQGRDQGDAKGSTVVTELTCLQLADTILRTKTADLSRIYQLCQTKIRYMDYLERSTDVTNDADSKPSNSQDDDKPRGAIKSMSAQPYTLRLRMGKDLSQQKNPLGQEAMDADPAGTDGNGSGASSVSLPALPAGPTPQNLSSLSSTPRALWTNLNDSNPTYDTKQASVDYSYVPQGTLGKPILKAPPQEDPVYGVRCSDPFSRPRFASTNAHFGGALGVRGTTMYPLSSTDGRWGRVDAGGGGSRTHTSRGTTDMRNRRAVRFNISDQVHEFTPSEPLVP